MIQPGVFADFLHNAHVFASAVREILEEKYLRQTTELDINLPQFNLLQVIAYNGHHQGREIADFLGVSQPAASKNVDKLVRMGLVTREVQQDDRRGVSLNLTGRGRKIIRKYEILKEEKLQGVLDNLSLEELHALTRGLEKVSHLILEREEDFGEICMKCNAYYVEHCPLRTLHDSCIYARTRKQLTH